MAVYPSIYKAKAVQATATSITAYVPQVFGDTPVVINDLLGPPAPGMGWVFFQAGNPEHPVWTTSNTGGGDSSGGGTDEVLISYLAPEPGTSHELWFDPDASAASLLLPNEVFVGTVQPTDPAAELWVKTNENNALYAKVSGSWTKIIEQEVTVGTVQPTDPGAELWIKTSEANALYAKVSGTWVKVSAAASSVPNEVHVSATDPIDTYPELELWVDSTAVSPLVDDARWHTAWGRVGTISNGTDYANISTETAVNSGSFNFVAGRRYSLMVRQAIAATVATDLFFLRAFIGGTQLLHLNHEGTTTRVYHAPSVSYVPSASGSLAVSVTIMRASGSGVAYANNYNYISAVADIIDEGPAVPAAPIPQPTVGLESAKPATPATPMRYFATDTQRDWLYDGTGWIIMGEPLMSYVPATTFMNLGTGGSSVGSYHRSDGWCDFTATVTLGTGGALTGQPTVALPNPTAGFDRYHLAVSFLQAGVNNYRGVHEGLSASSTAVTIYRTWDNANVGLESANNISATTPFTWSAGCAIRMAGRYRLFSRYS